MKTILLLFSTASILFSAYSQPKPNVIIIIADDLGYASTSPFGGDPNKVRTPHLQQFANEGMCFTNAYVTNSVCSPSRAGLVTGRYQQRFGYYSNVDGHGKHGLPVSEKIIATYFKEAGYATSMIGKWNLGVDQKGQHPFDKGFDEYYGFNNTQTDYFNSPILFRGREKVSGHKYLTQQFSEEAVDFIGRNKEKPFFLYLAFNAVHGPTQAPQETIDGFSNLSKKDALQAAMVQELDNGVGSVMGALKKHGIDKNTLVFFLSDNGGLESWWPGSNGKLKGFKRELWEGGIRVQCMVKWPERLPAGVITDEMVHSLDIAPTALAAAGITLPQKMQMDGKSMIPLFKEPKKPIHEYLFWAGGNMFVPAKNEALQKADPPHAWAVRNGDYKLIGFMETNEVFLFNLKEDPLETTNLAVSQTEKLNKMKAAFVDWFSITGGKPIASSETYFSQLKSMK